MSAADHRPYLTQPLVDAPLLLILGVSLQIAAGFIRTSRARANYGVRGIGAYGIQYALD
jgi:hypothetical protein